MNKKGIAFLDDLVDNLITLLLIVIVFVMTFFITSGAKNAMENNYEEHLTRVQNNEYLTDLLRQETSQGETVQELLKDPNNNVNKGVAEDFLTAYFDGVYGNGNWGVILQYPTGDVKYGSNLILKTLNLKSHTASRAGSKANKKGDIAETFILTETAGELPTTAKLIVQGVVKV